MYFDFGDVDDYDEDLVFFSNAINQDLRLRAPVMKEPFEDSVLGYVDKCKFKGSVVDELNDFFILKRRIYNDHQFSSEPHYILGSMLKYLSGDIQQRPRISSFSRDAFNVATKVTSMHIKGIFKDCRNHSVPKTRDLEHLSNNFLYMLRAREIFDEAVIAHSENTRIKGSCAMKWENLGAIEGHALYSKEVVPGISLIKYKRANVITKAGINGLEQLCFLYGDGLRMFADVVSSRMLQLNALSIARQRESPGYPEEKDVLYLWSIFDDLMEKRGNTAYDSIKLLEAIVTGEMIRRTKHHVINDDLFFNTMMQDLKDSGGEAICKKISKFFNRIPDINQLSQMFGMFRNWGHPVVDTKRGIEKMKMIGQAAKDHCPEEALKIECLFKETFFKNYRMKHGNWPKYDLIGEEADRWSRRRVEPKTVLDSLHYGVDVDVKAAHYELFDWRFVKISKIFVPDEHISELRLLADKAASLKRSVLEVEFEAGRPIPSVDERRVLLNFIKNRHQSILDILSKIDEDGFVDDDLVIGLTSKERELKINPRLFAMMTEKVRHYITATEKLIADCILPYVPQIMMNKSGNEVLHRMLEATKGMKAQGDVVQIVINFDFEKWNLQQRGCIVNPLFRFMDDSLGYKDLLARTHSIFEKSIFYRADNYKIPSGEEFRNGEGEAAYDGQEGGVEGWRQKGWTCVSAMGFLLAAREVGVEIDMMAQGDNQVIILKVLKGYATSDVEGFDPTENVRKVHSQFLMETFRIFDKLGMPLKRMETWSSTSMFAYGKNLIYEGQLLMMSLKKIGRIHFLSNEDYPSYSNQVSGIFSSFIAASEADVLPIVPYECALFELCHAYNWAKGWTPSNPKGISLKHSSHPLLKLKDGRDIKTIDLKTSSGMVLEDHLEEYIILMSLFGSALGGYATQPLAAASVKGFPDNLSFELGVIKKFVLNNSLQGTRISKMLYSAINPEVKSDCDYSQLASDPSAINILRPVQANNVMKSAASDLMNSDYVQNEVIKVLANLDKEDFNKVCHILAQAKPLNPRFLSLIAESIPPGIGRMLMAKYETTSSIQKTARKMLANTGRGRQMATLEARLAEAESDAHKMLIWSASRELQEFWDFCTYTEASRMRKVSWKREDLMGVTVPHPISFISFESISNGICKACKDGRFETSAHMSVSVNQRIKFKPSSIFENMGPGNVYTGGTTKSKETVSSDYRFENNDTIIQKCKSIASCLGWIIREDSMMWEDLQKWISTMTDTPVEYFVSSILDCNSSQVHRLCDPNSSHSGSPGTIPTPSSWLNVSTNSMNEYSKGGTNYAIHYQALISYCQFFSCFLIGYLKKDEVAPNCIHGHIERVDEIPQVEEGNIDYETSFFREIEPIIYPSYPNLSPLYCSMERAKPIKKPHGFQKEVMYNIEDLSVQQKMELRKNIHRQELIRNLLSDFGRAYVTRMWDHHIDYVWYKKMDMEDVITYICFSLCCAQFFESGFGMLNCRSPRECLSRIAQRALNSVNVLSSKSFSSIGMAYFVRESKEQLNTSGVLEHAHSLNPTTNEANSWGKQNVINMLSRWSATGIPYCEKLFKYETIGNPLTAYNARINFSGLLINVLSQGTKPCTASEALNTMIKGMQYFGKENADQMIPLVIPRVSTSEETGSKLASMILESISNSVIVQTADEIEKQLRTIPTENKMIQQRVGEARLPSPHFSLIATWNCDGSNEYSTAVYSTGRLFKKGVDSIKTCPCRHALKPDSDTTSAFYKYLTFIGSFVRGEVKNIACFADGVGGLASALYQIYKADTIFFNSLIDMSENPPSSHTEIYPPALESSRIPREKVLGIDLLSQNISDLRSAEYPESFFDSVQDKRFDIMTCDAEGLYGDLDHSKDIAENMIKMADKLSDNGILVYKTYSSRSDQLVYLFALFCESFNTVEVIKSHFSGHNSSEVFFIASKKLASRKVLIRELKFETLIDLPSTAIKMLIKSNDRMMGPASFDMFLVSGEIRRCLSSHYNFMKGSNEICKLLAILGLRSNQRASSNTIERLIENGLGKHFTRPIGDEGRDKRSKKPAFSKELAMKLFRISLLLKLHRVYGQNMYEKLHKLCPHWTILIYTGVAEWKFLAIPGISVATKLKSMWGKGMIRKDQFLLYGTLDRDITRKDARVAHLTFGAMMLDRILDAPSMEMKVFSNNTRDPLSIQIPAMLPSDIKDSLEGLTEIV